MPFLSAFALKKKQSRKARASLRGKKRGGLGNKRVFAHAGPHSGNKKGRKCLKSKTSKRNNLGRIRGSKSSPKRQFKKNLSSKRAAGAVYVFAVEKMILEQKNKAAFIGGQRRVFKAQKYYKDDEYFAILEQGGKKLLHDLHLEGHNINSPRYVWTCSLPDDNSWLNIKLAKGATKPLQDATMMAFKKDLKEIKRHFYDEKMMASDKYLNRILKKIAELNIDERNTILELMDYDVNNFFIILDLNIAFYTHHLSSKMWNKIMHALNGNIFTREQHVSSLLELRLDESLFNLSNSVLYYESISTWFDNLVDSFPQLKTLHGLKENYMSKFSKYHETLEMFDHLDDTEKRKIISLISQNKPTQVINIMMLKAKYDAYRLQRSILRYNPDEIIVKDGQWNFLFDRIEKQVREAGVLIESSEPSTPVFRPRELTSAIGTDNYASSTGVKDEKFDDQKEYVKWIDTYYEAARYTRFLDGNFVFTNRKFRVLNDIVLLKRKLKLNIKEEMNDIIYQINSNLAGYQVWDIKNWQHMIRQINGRHTIMTNVNKFRNLLMKTRNLDRSESASHYLWELIAEIFMEIGDVRSINTSNFFLFNASPSDFTYANVKPRVTQSSPFDGALWTDITELFTITQLPPKTINLKRIKYTTNNGEYYSASEFRKNMNHIEWTNIRGTNCISTAVWFSIETNQYFACWVHGEGDNYPTILLSSDSPVIESLELHLFFSYDEEDNEVFELRNFKLTGKYEKEYFFTRMNRNYDAFDADTFMKNFSQNLEKKNHKQKLRIDTPMTPINQSLTSEESVQDSHEKSPSFTVKTLVWNQPAKKLESLREEKDEEIIEQKEENFSSSKIEEIKCKCEFYTILPLFANSIAIKDRINKTFWIKEERIKYRIETILNAAFPGSFPMKPIFDNFRRSIDEQIVKVNSTLQEIKNHERSLQVSIETVNNSEFCTSYKQFKKNRIGYSIKEKIQSLMTTYHNQVLNIANQSLDDDVFSASMTKIENLNEFLTNDVDTRDINVSKFIITEYGPFLEIKDSECDSHHDIDKETERIVNLPRNEGFSEQQATQTYAETISFEIPEMNQDIIAILNYEKYDIGQASVCSLIEHESQFRGIEFIIKVLQEEELFTKYSSMDLQPEQILELIKSELNFDLIAEKSDRDSEKEGEDGQSDQNGNSDDENKGEEEEEYNSAGDYDEDDVISEGGDMGYDLSTEDIMANRERILSSAESSWFGFELVWDLNNTTSSHRKLSFLLLVCALGDIISINEVDPINLMFIYEKTEDEKKIGLYDYYIRNIIAHKDSRMIVFGHNDDDELVTNVVKRGIELEQHIIEYSEYLFDAPNQRMYQRPLRAQEEGTKIYKQPIIDSLDLIKEKMINSFDWKNHSIDIEDIFFVLDKDDDFCAFNLIVTSERDREYLKKENASHNDYSRFKFDYHLEYSEKYKEYNLCNEETIPYVVRFKEIFDDGDESPVESNYDEDEEVTSDNEREVEEEEEEEEEREEEEKEEEEEKRKEEKEEEEKAITEEDQVKKKSKKIGIDITGFSFRDETELMEYSHKHYEEIIHHENRRHIEGVPDIDDLSDGYETEMEKKGLGPELAHQLLMRAYLDIDSDDEEEEDDEYDSEGEEIKKTDKTAMTQEEAKEDTDVKEDIKVEKEETEEISVQLLDVEQHMIQLINHDEIMTKTYGEEVFESYIAGLEEITIELEEFFKDVSGYDLTSSYESYGDFILNKYTESNFIKIDYYFENTKEETCLTKYLKHCFSNIDTQEISKYKTLKNFFSERKEVGVSHQMFAYYSIEKNHIDSVYFPGCSLNSLEFLLENHPDQEFLSDIEESSEIDFDELGAGGNIYDYMSMEERIIDKLENFVDEKDFNEFVLRLNLSNEQEREDAIRTTIKNFGIVSDRINIVTLLDMFDNITFEYDEEPHKNLNFYSRHRDIFFRDHPDCDRSAYEISIKKLFIKKEELQEFHLVLDTNIFKKIEENFTYKTWSCLFVIPIPVINELKRFFYENDLILYNKFVRFLSHNDFLLLGDHKSKEIGDNAISALISETKCTFVTEDKEFKTKMEDVGIKTMSCKECFYNRLFLSESTDDLSFSWVRHISKLAPHPTIELKLLVIQPNDVNVVIDIFGMSFSQKTDRRIPVFSKRAEIIPKSDFFQSMSYSGNVKDIEYPRDNALELDEIYDDMIELARSRDITHEFEVTKNVELNKLKFMKYISEGVSNSLLRLNESRRLRIKDPKPVDLKNRRDLDKYVDCIYPKPSEDVRFDDFEQFLITLKDINGKSFKELRNSKYNDNLKAKFPNSQTVMVLNAGVIKSKFINEEYNDLEHYNTEDWEDLSNKFYQLEVNSSSLVKVPDFIGTSQAVQALNEANPTKMMNHYPFLEKICYLHNHINGIVGSLRKVVRNRVLISHAGFTNMGFIIPAGNYVDKLNSKIAFRIFIIRRKDHVSDDEINPEKMFFKPDVIVSNEHYNMIISRQYLITNEVNLYRMRLYTTLTPMILASDTKSIPLLFWNAYWGGSYSKGLLSFFKYYNVIINSNYSKLSNLMKKYLVGVPKRQTDIVLCQRILEIFNDNKQGIMSSLLGPCENIHQFLERNNCYSLPLPNTKSIYHNYQTFYDDIKANLLSKDEHCLPELYSTKFVEKKHINIPLVDHSVVLLKKKFGQMIEDEDYILFVYNEFRNFFFTTTNGVDPDDFRKKKNTLIVINEMMRYKKERNINDEYFDIFDFIDWATEKCLKQGGKAFISIKYQKDVGDREIYIQDFYTKAAHFHLQMVFKYMSLKWPEELVTKSEYQKLGMISRTKFDESSLFINDDMAKWSGQDIKQKFAVIIDLLHNHGVITGRIHEILKRSYIAVERIFIFFDRRLKNDTNLLYYRKEDVRSKLNGWSLANPEDKSAMTPLEITHGWPQGLMHFISSFAHGLCCLIEKECIRRAISGAHFTALFHSDDKNVSCYHDRGTFDMEEIAVIVNINSIIPRCFSLSQSKTKSSVSVFPGLFNIKMSEMVSVYNIGGILINSYMRQSATILTSLRHTSFIDNHYEIISRCVNIFNLSNNVFLPEIVYAIFMGYLKKMYNLKGTNCDRTLNYFGDKAISILDISRLGIKGDTYYKFVMSPKKTTDQIFNPVSALPLPISKKMRNEISSELKLKEMIYDIKTTSNHGSLSSYIKRSVKKALTVGSGLFFDERNASYYNFYKARNFKQYITLSDMSLNSNQDTTDYRKSMFQIEITDSNQEISYNEYTSGNSKFKELADQILFENPIKVIPSENFGGVIQRFNVSWGDAINSEFEDAKTVVNVGQEAEHMTEIAPIFNNIIDDINFFIGLTKIFTVKQFNESKNLWETIKKNYSNRSPISLMFKGNMAFNDAVFQNLADEDMKPYLKEIRPKMQGIIEKFHSNNARITGRYEETLAFTYLVIFINNIVLEFMKNEELFNLTDFQISHLRRLIDENLANRMISRYHSNKFYIDILKWMHQLVYYKKGMWSEDVMIDENLDLVVVAIMEDDRFICNGFISEKKRFINEFAPENARHYFKNRYSSFMPEDDPIRQQLYLNFGVVERENNIIQDIRLKKTDRGILSVQKLHNAYSGVTYKEFGVFLNLEYENIVEVKYKGSSVKNVEFKKLKILREVGCFTITGGDSLFYDEVSVPGPFKEKEVPNSAFMCLGIMKISICDGTKCPNCVKDKSRKTVCRRLSGMSDPVLIPPSVATLNDIINQTDIRLSAKEKKELIMKKGQISRGLGEKIYLESYLTFNCFYTIYNSISYYELLNWSQGKPPYYMHQLFRRIDEMENHQVLVSPRRREYIDVVLNYSDLDNPRWIVGDGDTFDGVIGYGIVPTHIELSTIMEECDNLKVFENLEDILTENESDMVRFALLELDRTMSNIDKMSAAIKEKGITLGTMMKHINVFKSLIKKTQDDEGIKYLKKNVKKILKKIEDIRKIYNDVGIEIRPSIMYATSDKGIADILDKLKDYCKTNVLAGIQFKDISSVFYITSIGETDVLPLNPKFQIKNKIEKGIEFVTENITAAEAYDYYARNMGDQDKAELMIAIQRSSAAITMMSESSENADLKKLISNLKEEDPTIMTISEYEKSEFSPTRNYIEPVNQEAMHINNMRLNNEISKINEVLNLQRAEDMQNIKDIFKTPITDNKRNNLAAYMILHNAHDAHIVSSIKERMDEKFAIGTRTGRLSSLVNRPIITSSRGFKSDKIDVLADKRFINVRIMIMGKVTDICVLGFLKYLSIKRGICESEYEKAVMSTIIRSLSLYLESRTNFMNKTLEERTQKEIDSVEDDLINFRKDGVWWDYLSIIFEDIIKSNPHINIQNLRNVLDIIET